MKIPNQLMLSGQGDKLRLPRLLHRNPVSWPC